MNLLHSNLNSDSYLSANPSLNKKIECTSKYMQAVKNNNKNTTTIYALSFLGVFVFLNSIIHSPLCAQQEVSIIASGMIKPQCGFKQSDNPSTPSNSDVLFAINPDDTDWASQTRAISLSLACNAPFNLAIRSQNGALVNRSSDTLSIGGNFSNLINYNLGLTISTEDPTSPLALACTSRDMISNQANCNASSGTNAAVGFGAGIGEVAISLSGSSQIPIRGRYHDTIVLAVAFQ